MSFILVVVRFVLFSLSLIWIAAPSARNDIFDGFVNEMRRRYDLSCHCEEALADAVIVLEADIYMINSILIDSCDDLMIEFSVCASLNIIVTL